MCIRISVTDTYIYIYSYPRVLSAITSLVLRHSAIIIEVKLNIIRHIFLVLVHTCTVCEELMPKGHIIMVVITEVRLIIAERIRRGTE